MSAPHSDPYWREVIQFLDAAGVSRERIVAPREFGPSLAGSVNYASTRPRLAETVEAVVVHKGWVPQIDTGFLVAMVSRLRPVAANAVFVVYGSPRLGAEVSGDHVEAFLEIAPPAVRAALEAPQLRGQALMVFLGNGRMLCRDPEFRKIVVPSRPSALLAALADGDDVIGAIRERIAPALAGARRLIDLGAGCGLFLLAAKTVADEASLALAVEDDEALAACLKFNVDLGGLYWRTEFAAVLDGPRERQFVARHKTIDWDPASGCDALHLDLGWDCRPQGRDLEGILTSRGRPTVVASHGLSTRIAPDAAARWRMMAATLAGCGYAVPEGEPLGRPGALPGEEIVVFRANR